MSQASKCERYGQRKLETMIDTLSDQDRDALVESLPSREEMTEMEIEYRQNLLAHWTQIQNHALAEGAEYHRNR